MLCLVVKHKAVLLNTMYFRKHHSYIAWKNIILILRGRLALLKKLALRESCVGLLAWIKLGVLARVFRRGSHHIAISYHCEVSVTVAEIIDS